MHNQPLQLQASIQMLPSADGYLAEITDPSSAWHGFFAFGSDHHAAQRNLVQTVWEHLSAAGQITPTIPGVALQILKTTWFPRNVLDRAVMPTPAGATPRPLSAEKPGKE